MGLLARADLEHLLRARKLDRTLTSALPVPAASPGQADELIVSPTGVLPLDARLGGGLPRGQLSEIVGPRSSGRTSLLLRVMRAALARGELVALVDALDRFDVPSAAAAALACDRLLWIRGQVASDPGLCRDWNPRALDHALKALTLVLQAGLFGLVVFDVADAPPDALRRLPFTTWLRLQRMIEGSQTTCVLVGAERLARSTAGITLELGAGRSASADGRRADPLASPAAHRPTPVFRNGWFEGLEFDARVAHARTHCQEETTVALATIVPECA